ncbi:MAG: glucosamine-6-phosphate deaminase [Acidobacteria bacterium 13_1_40CM_3_65_5]|nr:MAG: glucosamine-6-phosphate deaminase [Acidobacteria bacterium 13_1_40CM_3_65_5]OLE82167.1 MAG: glucosamine-6-phosphate deaminase [Acidobacteria bacterium 13_1_20CM_2_65_9]
MRVHTFSDGDSLARAAANEAASRIRLAIATSGRARIIAATGTSQMAFLDALTQAPDVDWSNVEMFHLDEYIGLPADHPAAFRRYLLERLIRPAGIARAHLIDGERHPLDVCRELGREATAAPIDVAFVGIGENGHLAFNDPPADFDTEEPYLVVRLDEACRRQQVGEQWFTSIDEVPERAITMSIRQILKSRAILAVVPEARKAPAVRLCLEGAISPMAPASILRTHADTSLFLDADSAALVKINA